MQQGGLRQFERLTKASVEGLRYRAEDIARSLTKPAIKEACSPLPSARCKVQKHSSWHKFSSSTEVVLGEAAAMEAAAMEAP